MYIYAFSNHKEIVIDELSNKKALLKKRVNRSDNFTNLTLLGVEQCLGDIQLNKNTNLYIASNNGNMNSTMKILDAIFKQDKLPMPFNFLNSVNASLLFFVAKNFGIEGKAIFTDTFESALTQAYVDVQNGKTVLLGNVSEAIADLDLHRKKFKVSEIVEQSQWLLVSPKIEKQKPIAEISNLKIKDSNSNSIDNLFSFLDNTALVGTDPRVCPFSSKNLSFIITKC